MQTSLVTFLGLLTSQRLVFSFLEMVMRGENNSIQQPGGLLGIAGMMPMHP